MPLIGYLVRINLFSFIESIDNWVAFILLVLIGVEMTYESFNHSDLEEEILKLTNKVLFMLVITDAMVTLLDLL